MSSDLKTQFLNFCRSKPADEEYSFFDTSNCAFSQFLRAYGYAEEPTCSGLGWRDLAKGEAIGAHPLPKCFHGGNEQSDWILAAEPNTFGALAARIEAAR